MGLREDAYKCWESIVEDTSGQIFRVLLLKSEGNVVFKKKRLKDITPIFGNVEIVGCYDENSDFSSFFDDVKATLREFEG